MKADPGTEMLRDKLDVIFCGVVHGCICRECTYPRVRSLIETVATIRNIRNSTNLNYTLWLKEEANRLMDGFKVPNNDEHPNILDFPQMKALLKRLCDNYPEIQRAWLLNVLDP